MPTGILEHVNFSVSDPARSAALFETLFDWKIRWEGPSQLGGNTIHTGNEDNYIALYSNSETRGGFKKGIPLNHVGIMVSDLDSVESLVREAGLKPFGHSQYHPGPRSFYFFDWDGIEFEVVSYE